LRAAGDGNMEQKKTKQKNWPTILFMVLTAGGLIAVLLLGQAHGLDILWIGAGYIVTMSVTLLLQLILHEFGHLLGGLASGYVFVFFRILNIQIMGQNGKLIRKKFHIVGTGGQCLMAPPKPYDPDFPYKLYNLAGGFFNLLMAGIALFLIILLSLNGHPGSLWILFLVPLFTAGVYCGATNLIPMFVGGIANDGWNVAHLGKDPEARRILWFMLDVMAFISQGGRFRDLPEEWFELGGDIDFTDYYRCALAVYRFNYLEDGGRLSEACELAGEILAEGENIPQIYRYELACERIFLELIGEGGPIPSSDQEQRHATVLARVTALYTPELQHYIKATATYPQRQRLNYALAKLYTGDEAAGQTALKKFVKACKTYPNSGEIQSEWELIGLVDCALAQEAL